jgi:hypothetical protein
MVVDWPLVVWTLVVGGTLVGFFCTKSAGWGPLTTSLPLLLVALFLAGLALLSGKAEWTAVGNLVFAVVGYAGGLITPKKDQNTPKKNPTSLS